MFICQVPQALVFDHLTFWLKWKRSSSSLFLSDKDNLKNNPNGTRLDSSDPYLSTGGQFFRYFVIFKRKYHERTLFLKFGWPEAFLEGKFEKFRQDDWDVWEELPRCMCVGVPMRKHTWKAVSPTAPLTGPSFLSLAGSFYYLSCHWWVPFTFKQHMHWLFNYWNHSYYWLVQFLEATTLSSTGSFYMIERSIEDQAFLRLRYSAPPQLSSPSLVNKLSIFLSLPVCRRSSLRRGGVGWGGETNQTTASKPGLL